jgi:hypothetical protein
MELLSNQKNYITGLLIRLTVWDAFTDLQRKKPVPVVETGMTDWNQNQRDTEKYVSACFYGAGALRCSRMTTSGDARAAQ